MVDELSVIGTDGITRSLDEHYDVQSVVENDPCGALFAIQNQAARIAHLEAQVAAADALAERARFWAAHPTAEAARDLILETQEYDAAKKGGA